jgi:hypothetical protein
MAQWHIIDDTQTPIGGGAFQKGPFQKCYEQGISILPIWVVVNDDQLSDKFGGFQANEFQPNEFESYSVSSWSLVNDNQTPIVAGAFQKGPFQKNFEQGVSQIPVWVSVNTSQP